MTEAQSEPDALREAGQQLGRLRGTEAGKQVLREASVIFLEKKCKACIRAPTKFDPSDLLDRIPPSDVRMEKRLVGALLLDPRTYAVVTPILKAKHFHSQLNAGWYDRLTESQREKCPPDISLFLTWLQEHYGRGELGRLGGPAYLAEAMHDSPMSYGYTKHYATVIRNHATRRNIMHAATQLLVDAHAADMTLQELIDKCRAVLEGVLE